jgi:predicted TIM-barrel fold metal-dependent hydrolase
MHIHFSTEKDDPHKLVSQMERSGVFGGAIFSVPPRNIGLDKNASGGEARLTDIVNFTKDYPDRLLPLLWVHPDEPDISGLVKEAVRRGIRGFKIICNNFYVYENKSMKLLEVIAETGLPVCFHSGILWDRSVSGQYNRPLNWEHLIEIPRIRFSLAHCGWPWYDECIAVYSKFLSLANQPDFTPEMFFDLTPGTPPPYRRDLLTKLIESGFDVDHHMMFGTDCNTSDYKTEWARKWIKTDAEIFKSLNVTEEAMERIFSKNMLRFFRVSKETYRFKGVTPDGS